MDFSTWGLYFSIVVAIFLVAFLIRWYQGRVATIRKVLYENRMNEMANNGNSNQQGDFIYSIEQDRWERNDRQSQLIRYDDESLNNYRASNSRDFGPYVFPVEKPIVTKRDDHLPTYEEAIKFDKNLKNSDTNVMTSHI